MQVKIHFECDGPVVSEPRICNHAHKNLIKTLGAIGSLLEYHKESMPDGLVFMVVSVRAGTWATAEYRLYYSVYDDKITGSLIIVTPENYVVHCEALGSYIDPVLSVENTEDLSALFRSLSRLAKLPEVLGDTEVTYISAQHFLEWRCNHRSSEQLSYLERASGIMQHAGLAAVPKWLGQVYTDYRTHGGVRPEYLLVRYTESGCNPYRSISDIILSLIACGSAPDHDGTAPLGAGSFLLFPANLSLIDVRGADHVLENSPGNYCYGQSTANLCNAALSDNRTVFWRNYPVDFSVMTVRKAANWFCLETTESQTALSRKYRALADDFIKSGVTHIWTADPDSKLVQAGALAGLNILPSSLYDTEAYREFLADCGKRNLPKGKLVTDSDVLRHAPLVSYNP